MQTRKTQATAAVLAVALVVSGCNTVAGALTGGALGAGLGAIAGSMRGEAAKGTAVGAIVGSALGAAVGLDNDMQRANRRYYSYDRPYYPSGSSYYAPVPHGSYEEHHYYYGPPPTYYGRPYGY